MSKGLQDYYNSVGGYTSNIDSINNYLANSDDSFYNDFQTKINEKKEEAKALIETGGAVEGVYMGFKGVQQGIRGWRSKYGKNNSSDETGQGEDSNGGNEESLNDNEVEQPEGLEGAGFNEEDASGLFEDEPVARVGQSRPLTGGLNEVDDLGGDLLDQGQATTQSLYSSSQIPIPESLTIPPETTPLTTQPLLGGSTITEDVSGGLTDAASNLVPTITNTATETASGVLTSVLGEGGAAALGVGLEAVPILGGAAALGVGLYEMFHHSSKPKPPAQPLTASTVKGEVVTPSFDSVVDMPANNSAF